jgi:hypothetical protein
VCTHRVERLSCKIPTFIATSSWPASSRRFVRGLRIELYIIDESLLLLSHLLDVDYIKA